MAKRFIRVDLSDNARDFRPVAIEPGVPVLDRSGAHGKILFRWLGGLVGEPEYENDSINFYARDDHGGRLEEVYVYSASDDDLKGSLKQDMELLRDRLSKARPETPTERSLLKAISENFQAATDDVRRADRECYFFRYKDVQGRWRLIWCPGYQRSDREPARVIICSNPKCDLLFVRRQGASAKCPACQIVPVMRVLPKPARKPRSWAALLLLLLLLLGAGALWWWMSGRLNVSPKELDLLVGEVGTIELQSQSDDPVVMTSSDSEVVSVLKDQKPAEPAEGQQAEDENAAHAKHRLVGRGEGEAEVTVAQGRKKGKIKVTVRRGAIESLVAEPGKVDVAAGESAPVALTATTETGRTFPVDPQAVSVKHAPAKQYATFDPEKLAIHGVAATNDRSPQTLTLAFEDREVKIPVHVTGQQVATAKPGGPTVPVGTVPGKTPPGEPPRPTAPLPKGKPVELHLVSDQGGSVRMPVGAEFDDFRVEAQYPDGFTRVVTRKATLASDSEPAKSPISFSGGNIVGVRPGKAKVSASFEGIAAKEQLDAEVTAEANVDEIQIAPSPLQMLPGETLPLVATGYQGGKSIGDISHLPGVKWTSSDDQVARLEGPAVTGLAKGNAKVSAQLGSVTSKPAEVSVVEEIKEALTVDEDLIRLRVGERCRLGTDLVIRRGPANVSEACMVLPAPGDIVGYDPDSRSLVGKQPGVSRVTFAMGNRTVDANVEVLPAPTAPADARLVIEPVGGVLSPGQALPLRAYLVTPDGLRLDRTGDVQFASSDPQKLKMSRDWACATAPGAAEVTATLGSEPGAPTGKAFITVDNNEIAELTAEPRRLDMLVQDRAGIRILGTSASGTHELYPQDKLKIAVGGDNPKAVNVVGSQHVDAVEPGSAELQIGWDGRLQKQIDVAVSAGEWSDLAIEPARTAIRPTQRVAYSVTAVRNGIRRPVSPSEGLRLSVADPRIGRVVDETWIRGGEPGDTRVEAQFGNLRTDAALAVVPRTDPIPETLIDGTTRVDEDGARWVVRDGRWVRIVDSGETPVITSVGPAPDTPRFRTVRTAVSNRVYPTFRTFIDVEADTTAEPLEYRAYRVGGKPPETWQKAEPIGGGRQQVRLETPPIENSGTQTDNYDVTIESRSPADNSTERYNVQFRLVTRPE